MVDTARVSWDYLEAVLAADIAARVTWDYIEAVLVPASTARVMWDYIEVVSVGIADDIAWADAEAIAPLMVVTSDEGPVGEVLPTPATMGEDVNFRFPHPRPGDG